MNNILAMNTHLAMTQDEIEELEASLYNSEEHLKCVDAVHFDADGCESSRYTWYIPTGFYFDIEIGDTLAVEQSTGIGLAFVRVETPMYFKSRKEHISDLHPYCKVIKNLGNFLEEKPLPELPF